MKLCALAQSPPGALAFTGPEGMALSDTNFRWRVWVSAIT